MRGFARVVGRNPWLDWAGDMGSRPDFATVQIGTDGLRADELGIPLVSAIIPCLNEERTLGICIRKAFDVFAKRGIRGEVVVGDNGSSDRSVEIA